MKLGEETETTTDGASEGTAGPVTGDGTGETGVVVPDGELEWEVVLADFAGYAMAVGPDGTIVVVGERGFTPQGDGGVFASRWMGKFAADGEMVWLRETPNTEENYAIPYAVSVGPGGQIFVGAVDYGAQENGGNAVHMHDADGEEVWVTVVPARINAVQATPEGGAIAGGVKPLDGNSGLGWVLALDEDGAALWEQTYPAPEQSYTMVRSIAIAGDDIVLAGSVGVGPSTGRTEAWLHRAARASGAEVWDQTVTTAEATDWAEQVAVTTDGTIVALVTAGGFKTVRAYAPDGAELWSYAPELATGGDALAVASDGAFTVSDGLFLPIDDPEACMGDFSPCPVRMQIERRGFDRAALWQHVSAACQSAYMAETLPNDGVVVFAGCADEPGGSLRSGLLRFAP